MLLKAFKSKQSLADDRQFVETAGDKLQLADTRSASSLQTMTFRTAELDEVSVNLLNIRKDTENAIRGLATNIELAQHASQKIWGAAERLQHQN